MAGVKLRILLISALSSILLITAAMAVRAQTATVTEQTPAQRCLLTQNYLRTIQKPRDLRARVDRLQAYRYIHQRLEVFTIRLEKNNQPSAKEFRAQLVQLNQVTESFKNHYEAYDLARETLTGIQNCRTNINEFQTRLTQLREARQKVHDDVKAVEKLLSLDIPNQLRLLKAALEVSND